MRASPRWCINTYTTVCLRYELRFFLRSYQQVLDVL